jgi:hypothetical protein
VRRSQHFAVWQVQLNGARELLAGHFGKPLGNFLIGSVLNLPARQPLPELDPDAAETAVTIENQERNAGRRGIQSVMLTS